MTQGGSYSRQTWIIDLDHSSVERSVKMKEKMNFVTSAVLGSTVYVFGGKSTLGDAHRLRTCERLDTSKLPLNLGEDSVPETGQG